MKTSATLRILFLLALLVLVLAAALALGAWQAAAAGEYRLYLPMAWSGYAWISPPGAPPIGPF